MKTTIDKFLNENIDYSKIDYGKAAKRVGLTFSLITATILLVRELRDKCKVFGIAQQEHYQLCKQNAYAKGIALAKTKMKECDKSKNPKICKQRIQAIINKWEEHRKKMKWYDHII